jgi:hypothetical protein
MNAADQLAAIKMVSTPKRRILVKEVSGGFNIQGVESFHDNSTGSVLAEKSDEGVAANTDDAIRMFTNYLLNGTFDDPLLEDTLQPSLFDEPQAAAPGAITDADAKPTVI